MELDTKTVPSPTTVIHSANPPSPPAEAWHDIVPAPDSQDNANNREVMRLLVAMILAILSMLGTMFVVYR